MKEYSKRYESNFKVNSKVKVCYVCLQKQMFTNKDKVYNTQLIINNRGDMVASYRKLHLFDAELGNLNNKLNESSSITAGEDIVAPIETPCGKLGLMIVSLIIVPLQIDICTH